MLEFIGLYKNPHAEEFYNPELFYGSEDRPITEYIITAMRDLESIDNIKIENIEVVDDPSKVDINRYLININFKKKNIQSEFPKHKLTNKYCFGEIIFTIRVTTNLNEKVVEKRILYPIEIAPNTFLNGKKSKAIWQLVDASTYVQINKITLKSRMPIILFSTTKIELTDVQGTMYSGIRSFTYALESKSKRPGTKKRPTFINILLIYMAKLGFTKMLEFFGVDKVISATVEYTDDELDDNVFFKWGEVFLKINRAIFEKHDWVRSMIVMLQLCDHRQNHINWEILEDRTYWTARVGLAGSSKQNNLSAFLEKGTTTMFMVERLLDQFTIHNLRLPHIYKKNIYYLFHWMMTNFTALKNHVNIDMENKRIRRNEYIVLSSLARKISENLNKFVERRSKSTLNEIGLLLELLNFNADIIISNMKSLNDLIRTDDLVNDLDFLLNISYSSKGPNSLGESSSKAIATKYRYLHPSMLGILDVNQSSQSDVGLSGSFVPWVNIHPGGYFVGDQEPCQGKYLIDKALQEDGIDLGLDTSTFENYIKDLEDKNWYGDNLKYAILKVVEKE